MTRRSFTHLLDKMSTFLLLFLIVGVMSEGCPSDSEEFCCFGEKCRENEDYYVLPTPGSDYDDCYA